MGEESEKPPQEKKDTSNNEGEENPTEEAASSNPFLKDLCILPPLQSFGGSNEGGVPLPPIRSEEPVSSLRAALSEVRGYAHLTNYRFILEKTKGQASSSPSLAAEIGSDPSQVVSPFTGPDALVAVPFGVKSLDDSSNDKDEEIVLDDYGDLQPLLEKGLEDGTSFRVVLERYDAATVRDHVTRLRQLLDGNAPAVTSLAEDAAAPTTTEPDQEEKEEATEEDKGAKEDGPEKEKQLREAAKKSHEKVAAESLPTFPLDAPIAMDGNNLRDFYYLTCGEEELLSGDAANADTLDASESREKKSKKKKKKGKKTESADSNEEGSDKDVVTTASTADSNKSFQETCLLLNEMEKKTTIKCTIRYSGFHPPPPHRRLLGDLAYLEVKTPGYPAEPILHVTAIPTGFYINRTKVVDSDYKFDPSPAKVPCFSHELLDCLLQKSKSLREAWADALSASKERTSLTSSLNDTPLQSLHRVATRGDRGVSPPTSIDPPQGMDSFVLRPSWLVPLPRSTEWTKNSLHQYNPTKAEDDLSNMFGIDIRSAAFRDWNEELQSAREMPTDELDERIERARLINKVLCEFGDGAVAGTRAIVEGHMAPMNPNEPTRSHVYLHNNIFFSRAVDAGVETFKIARGDRAARKSASRDAQCVGSLHRMDLSGLHSLATVLVDYLGTRFVCQSIVPGILHGEKTHTLLYGSVEATAPLAWDKEMHELLEEKLGKTLMIGTRTIPRMPLSDERLDEIERLRTTPAMAMPETENDDDDKKTNLVCGPVEAKGIRGSDQRNYVLDLTRLTPRDANWVPKSEGGTGKWEAVLEEGTNGKSRKFIPESLDDDEWTVAILRPELVTKWTHMQMTNYLRKNQENESKGEGKTDTDDKNKEEASETNVDPKEQEATEVETTEDKTGTKDSSEGDVKGDLGDRDDKDKKDEPSTQPTKIKLEPEDEKYLKSLRLNLNVFLPHLRSLEGIDDDAVAELKLDEERTREVSAYLWDEILPRATKEIRDGVGHPLPVDGKSLTAMLQQRGINCRYLGRLAALAAREEENDIEAVALAQAGKSRLTSRRVMPQTWLELLECEMVARAAKHVLESYLNENGATAAIQPAQTIASFLSALVSTGEETAGETEMRIEKEEKSDASAPDEDDFNGLTMFDTGGSGDAVPSPVRSRTQVWEDIQREVGRRFRYNLALYNNSANSGRALYTPLLRRVCQRNGIRLVARNYAVGGKCLCSGGNSSGGRISPSYPISPVDVVDVVPLVKHAAAQGSEGFFPYHLGATAGPPSLHIVLQDAKSTFEAAHFHYSARALPQALDLAQEAASLYQRVTDTPLHSNVARCLDLTAAILFDAQEPQLAAANSARALGVVVQLGGFDCPEALTSLTSLSNIMFSSGALAGGVKHLRAAMYLMELLGGPRYPELSSCYHRLATVYHDAGDGLTALRFFTEASARPTSDRLMEGMISKSTAMALANLGQFKAALDCEKRAYHVFSLCFGERHEATRNSADTMVKFMKAAVEQGKSQVEQAKKRKQEEAADAIASQIEADEVEEEKKKKEGKKGKKKKT